ncbi:carboxylic acid reductase [Pelomyxa schiedti]|nr:carboxylic acid reductase [Pelomyxa schiedti]
MGWAVVACAVCVEVLCASVSDVLLWVMLDSRLHGVFGSAGARTSHSRAGPLPARLNDAAGVFGSVLLRAGRAVVYWIMGATILAVCLWVLGAESGSGGNPGTPLFYAGLWGVGSLRTLSIVGLGVAANLGVTWCVTMWRRGLTSTLRRWRVMARHLWDAGGKTQNWPARRFTERATILSVSCILSLSPCANIKQEYSARPFLGIPSPGGDDYMWLSYGEINKRVERLSDNLSQLHRATPGSTVAICGDNHLCWIICDYALLCASIVSVPIDPHANPEVSSRILHSAQASVMACDDEFFNQNMEMLKSIKTLRSIIVWGKTSVKGECTLNCKGWGATSVYLFTVLESSKSNFFAPIVSRDTVQLNLPKDAISIVFTSGSSGEPKGVVWTDRNHFKIAHESLGSVTPIVTIDFQPPFHAFSRRLTWRVFCNGGQVGIHFGDKSHLFKNIKSIRPTLIGAPPSFWSLLMSEYQEFLQSNKPTISEEYRALSHARLMLGNRVQWVITGGAATSEQLYNFLTRCFNRQVGDGYSTTETGTIAVNGTVSSSVDVVLHPLPDLDPISLLRLQGEGPNDTSGEICVESNSEYFDNAPLNASQFLTINGKRYFRTGDIGARCGGKIVIKARIGSVVKLSQGEFVCLEVLENTFEKSPEILQAYVYGSAFTPSVVGVIVPKNPSTSRSAIRTEILNLATENRLKPWEIPQHILLETVPFSQENGLLTAVGKKSRCALSRRYEKEILDLFAPCQETVTASGKRNPFVRVPQLGEALSTVTAGCGTALCDMPSVSFQHLGLDSLAAVRVIRALAESTGIMCNVVDLMQANSLLEFEGLVACQKEKTHSASVGKPQINWQLECTLPTNFTRQTLRECADVCQKVGCTQTLSVPASEDILVTGATGFLGPFLVKYLVEAFPGRKVYCIVRGDSDMHAQERYLNAAKTLNCLPADISRVLVLCGDVSSPLMGLSLHTYHRLAHEVADVVHNAARVNGVLPYSALKRINVGGTLEVIKFAASGPVKKHLHHISSVNVLRGKGAEDHPETPLHLDLYTLSELSNAPGYAATKFVSEVLSVSAGHSLSLPRVVVYRPSTISAHSESGCCNPTCFTTAVIRGLIYLGGYPAKTGIIPPNFLLTPVDYVCSVICTAMAVQKGFTAGALPQNIEVNPEVLHLVTPTPLSWEALLTHLHRYGYKLREMCEEEWFACLSEMPDTNPLAVFRQSLLLGGGFAGVEFDLGPDTSNTRKMMRQCGITCPAMTFEVFSRQLDFMVKSGLLPEPPSPSIPTVELMPEASPSDMYYRIERWYNDLKQVTFPTEFILLSETDARVLRSLSHSMLLSTESREAFSRERDKPTEYIMKVTETGVSKSGAVSLDFKLDAQNEEDFIEAKDDSYRKIVISWKETNRANWKAITDLESQLKILIESFPQGAFVRLSTRSPKDSAFATSHYHSILQQVKHQNPSLDQGVCEARAHVMSMCVTHAMDAIRLLLHSQRVMHDLRTCEMLGTFPVYVAIRKFEVFDTEWEFRLFVARGNLNAASMYHKHCFVPEIIKRHGDIEKAIFTAWESVAPKINCSDYTLDLVLSPNLSLLWVVEVNYPPPVASTILFDWNNPHDRTILSQGPYQLHFSEVKDFVETVATMQGDPTIVQMVMARLPLVNAWRCRGVNRTWRDHFRLGQGQFDQWWRSIGQSKDGCYVGFRCAEVFKGARSGCLLHLCMRPPATVPPVVATDTVDKFCRREAGSRSHILRGLSLLFRGPFDDSFIIQHITFSTAWGWTYDIFASTTGGHVIKYTIALSEAHLDYDSWGCEDWYETHPYSQVCGVGRW